MVCKEGLEPSRFLHTGIQDQAATIYGATHGLKFKLYITMKPHQLPIITIEDCNSLKDIAIKLNLSLNGRSNKIVKEYLALNSIDSSHLDPNKNRFRKYEIVSKECPVCSKIFETKKNSPDEKTTCSMSCANTHFRSGENHPNFKDGNTKYRQLVTIEKCNRCGFNSEPSILHVHHIDRNRSNNTFENLEVLCPNCHHLEHFRQRDGMFSHLKK